jgi:hypothetical protein
MDTVIISTTQMIEPLLDEIPCENSSIDQPLTNDQNSPKRKDGKKEKVAKKKEEALKKIKKEKIPKEKKIKVKKSRGKKNTGLQSNMVEAWNIQGIQYFIDNAYRIYKTEDIMRGSQNPTHVGHLDVANLSMLQIEQKSATVNNIVFC